MLFDLVCFSSKELVLGVHLLVEGKETGLELAALDFGCFCELKLVIWTDFWELGLIFVGPGSLELADVSFEKFVLGLKAPHMF